MDKGTEEEYEVVDSISANEEEENIDNFINENYINEVKNNNEVYGFSILENEKPKKEAKKTEKNKEKDEFQDVSKTKIIGEINADISKYNKHFVIMDSKDNLDFKVDKFEEGKFFVPEAKVELFSIFFKCKLLLTEYQLIIIPTISKELYQLFPENYFKIAIFKVNKLNINRDQSIPNKCYMEVETEDLRSFYVELKVDDDTRNLYNQLKTIVYPKNDEIFENFAKKYKIRTEQENKDLLNGYDIYSIEKEFARQGVQELKDVKLLNLNENFKICPSYPEKAYVVFMTNEPFTIEKYKDCAKYRTKRRFPALSYFYKRSRGTLWRSSQNKAGMMNNVSKGDVAVLGKIMALSNASEYKDISNKLYIYDARHYINACANRLKGAGFENVDIYSHTEINFCNIGNIHDARTAFANVKKLIQKNRKKDKIDESIPFFGSGLSIIDNKTFFSELEQTGWLDFLYKIISSALLIHAKIKLGYPVLIHCSDGWDRSSQLTALALILLDPYYRTIEGFAVLVEKEFVSFGHQFKYRLGLCAGDSAEKAPIFLQFLDSVHQILVKYPEIFEFNMDMLLFMAYHLDTCLYGTFLCNNLKERKERNITSDTVSIWTDIFKQKDKFINVFYDKNISETFEFKCFPYSDLRFWNEYFCNFIINLKDNKVKSTNLKEENIKLKSILKKLINSNDKNKELLNKEELDLLI